MPYCPRCDMEFIDGITVCSDCGEPLAASIEAAGEALREQQELARQEFELTQHELLQQSAEDFLYWDGDSDEEETSINAPSEVYVNKAQKHKDLTSSASALYLTGAVMLAISAAFWFGILILPDFSAFQITAFTSILTVLGILALAAAVHSTISAKALKPQIEDEIQNTQKLIQWFLHTYTGEDIDNAVHDASELKPEELSLRRFSIIQDYLITNHDLPDHAYVDMLTEELYTKLYE